eukprot:m.13725 g.13725  ORF g.13725 m.13725 type:complete len:70 (+) comp3074_c0_seq1:2244-2453(+)
MFMRSVQFQSTTSFMVCRQDGSNNTQPLQSRLVLLRGKQDDSTNDQVIGTADPLALAPVFACRSAHQLR